MQDDPVIRVVAKVLIPAIMLFALYVQFHGDYGPGGGFQAGVIFAAALVLNAVVFGLHRARQVWPMRYNLMGVSAGVVLYGGTGVWSMLAGANYLVAENFSEDFWLTWTTFLDMPVSIAVFYAIVYWARKKPSDRAA